MSSTLVCSSCQGVGEVYAGQLKEHDREEYSLVTCPYCHGRGYQINRELLKIQFDRKAAIEAAVKAVEELSIKMVKRNSST